MHAAQKSYHRSHPWQVGTLQLQDTAGPSALGQLVLHSIDNVLGFLDDSV